MNGDNLGSDKKDYFTIDDLELENKRILLRIDVNSPIHPVSKKILDDNRFRSHQNTFKALRNSKVTVLAHQSRPGKKDFTTTQKHAKKLSDILNRDVAYIDDIFGERARQEIREMKNGDIVFLENVRFYSEEVLERTDKKQKETYLVKKLAPLFDYYINDAFAAAHRAHPSITGFPRELPSLMGKLMQKEIKILNKMTQENGETHFVLGGTKVKDSLEVTKNLLKNQEATKVYSTGVFSLLLLNAKEIDIGKTNIEFLRNEINYKKRYKEAQSLLDEYPNRVELPKDVAINKDGERKDISINEIPQEYRIEDIGIETIVDFSEKLRKAQKIVMNGPAGVFEKEEFSIGTEEIQRTAVKSDAYSVIGGGHICTAAEKCGLKRLFDHVSTGGGALMNYFSSNELPALKSLKKSKQKFKNELKLPR